MLTKCFCIISYFPNDEPLRTNRKNSFYALLKNLDEYFKLPIIIVAQNGREEDYNLTYSNSITVYSYEEQLGVTGARIRLQNKLLENHNNFDYYIFLDDDSNLQITTLGVDNYFNELEQHKNMIGAFHGCWGRLLAISNEMLHKTNFDYIKNYESIRGEIGEDYCWRKVGEKIYPNKFFNFSMSGITDIFLGSEKDPNTTGYKNKPEFSNILSKSNKIIKSGYYAIRNN